MQNDGKCADGQECLNRWLCFMFRDTPANCIREDEKKPDKFTFRKFELIDKAAEIGKAL